MRPDGRKRLCEAVLRLSAEDVAGPPHRGRKGGAIGWHGREEGRGWLKERRLRVKRPRLRKKGQGEDGEVPITAYEAMRRDEALGSRMLEILLRGVSTRQYRAVLPEMAETVGVSRSSVSREAIEASEANFQRLCKRRFDEVKLLVLYLDGVIFGDHHVLVAVGADEEGKKHVLGLAEGASENRWRSFCENIDACTWNICLPISRALTRRSASVGRSVTKPLLTPGLKPWRKSGPPSRTLRGLGHSPESVVFATLLNTFVLLLGLASALNCAHEGVSCLEKNLRRWLAYDP